MGESGDGKGIAMLENLAVLKDFLPTISAYWALHVFFESLFLTMPIYKNTEIYIT